MSDDGFDGGALLSVPFAAAIVRKVDERRMKKIIAYVTIILGAVILLKVEWSG